LCSNIVRLNCSEAPGISLKLPPLLTIEPLLVRVSY